MPNPRFLIHDLNPAQRDAVEATTGPVCILAGAGTGKTRVISRRVGYAIATDAVHPGHVLVVTFTEKAAAEMRQRLAGLGFPGVQAHTFHAAAWRQLRYFWPRLSGGPLPEVLDSKAPLLTPLQRSLPGGYRFTAVKDLADEIEWAKARRLGPERYQAAIEQLGRTPPVPSDLMVGLYRRYERAKQRAGRIDFEDMLGLMLEALTTREEIAEEFRGRYRWFSVDEYQDTNSIQQALLEAWLGGRSDLAVVGDEDQTIYTFTGASSEYLTGFGRRWPDARLIRLEENYRSSPEVLAMANRLLARDGRRRGKRLVATCPSGPEPAVHAFESAETEATALVAEVRRLAELGVAAEEIAVLVRTNAQIPPLEEALGQAGIRYQVRGELFYRRPEVRGALGVLRSRSARAAGGGLVRAARLPPRRRAGGGGGAAAPRLAGHPARHRRAHAGRRRAGRPRRLPRRGRQARRRGERGRRRGREPAHLPPGQGAGVRRGAAAGPGGRAAAHPAGQRPGGGGRGAPPALCGTHPRPGPPLARVGGQASWGLWPRAVTPPLALPRRPGPARRRPGAAAGGGRRHRPRAGGPGARGRPPGRGAALLAQGARQGRRRARLRRLQRPHPVRARRPPAAQPRGAARRGGHRPHQARPVRRRAARHARLRARVAGGGRGPAGPGCPQTGRLAGGRGRGGAESGHGSADERGRRPAAGLPVLRRAGGHRRSWPAARLDHPDGRARADLPVRHLHPLQPALHRGAPVRPGSLARGAELRSLRRRRGPG